MSTSLPVENGQQALAEALHQQQAALERNQARAASAFGLGAEARARSALTLRVALDDDLLVAFNAGLRIESLLIQIIRLLQTVPATTTDSTT